MRIKEKESSGGAGRGAVCSPQALAQVQCLPLEMQNFFQLWLCFRITQIVLRDAKRCSVHKGLWKSWIKEETINYCRSYFNEKQDSYPRIYYMVFLRELKFLMNNKDFLLMERQYSKKTFLLFIHWIWEREWISLIYKGHLWEHYLFWLAAIIALFFSPISS